LATLVTLSDKGMDANHIPLLLRVAADGRTSLVGHVARANPIWKDADLSVPVLVIFQGPQHYISPGWYATKAEHGKVVPTWNYAVVHAKGLLTVHDDAAWIRSQMQQITTQQEAPMDKPMGRGRCAARLHRGKSDFRRGRHRDRGGRVGGQMEGQPEPAARQPDHRARRVWSAGRPTLPAPWRA